MEPPLTAPTPAPPKSELREMSGIQDEEAEEKHEEAKVETILKVEKNVMLAIISKCVCLSGGAEDY